jgi:pretoxin HINT domain-containing protein
VTALIRTEGEKHLNELSVATKDGIKKLTATLEHPFWSPSERNWLLASQLKPGMTLRTAKGDTVIVTANRPYVTHARTYNLTIENLHTYYVFAGSTPVLVHNSCGPYDEVAASLGSHVTTGQVVRAGGIKVGAPVRSGESGAWKEIEAFLADSPNIKNPRSGPHFAATHAEAKIAWAM